MRPGAGVYGRKPRVESAYICGRPGPGVMGRMGRAWHPALRTMLRPVALVTPPVHGKGAAPMLIPRLPLRGLAAYSSLFLAASFLVVGCASTPKPVSMQAP